MAVTPNEIIDFWQHEVTEPGWYKADDDVDNKIRDRYLDLWRTARAGDMDHWAVNAQGSLALLVVLDQFSRNMFRGSGDSFASDPKARQIAKRAITKKFDLEIEPPMRQFFYLPLMHSECIADQDMGVCMFKLRDPGDHHFVHPRAHRSVIRQFGRFPYRNEALGRVSTPAEIEYLDSGGYAHSVRTINAKLGLSE